MVEIETNVEIASELLAFWTNFLSEFQKKKKINTYPYSISNLVSFFINLCNFNFLMESTNKAVAAYCRASLGI